MHEGASMWLFHFFQKISFGFALNASLWMNPTSWSTTPRVKEDMLRTSRKVLKHFFQTCASDHVIPETDAALPRLQSALDYVSSAGSGSPGNKVA